MIYQKSIWPSMTLSLRGFGLLCVLSNFACLTFAPCTAQNIGISTPFTSAGASYFESTGISWGFGIPARGGNVMGLTPGGQLTPHIGFSWNGGNIAPQFGGYNPNAGARLDIQGRNFSLGLSMAKGASRSLVSQAPSIMVQNGQGGFLFSGQSTPFVTGMIPVIGDQPLDNAVTRALQSGQLDLTYRPEEVKPADEAPLLHHSKSSATQGSASIASIRQEKDRKARENQAKCQALIAEAKQLLESNRRSMARNKLRQALELTESQELKKLIRTEIEALRSTQTQAR
jgi:hypothetical protein